ncbi:unnamed protein product [Arctogadus glacialis]
MGRLTPARRTAVSRSRSNFTHRPGTSCSLRLRAPRTRAGVPAALQPAHTSPRSGGPDLSPSPLHPGDQRLLP